MENNTVFYDEVKDELKTGDLILFHGTLLSSEINELLVRSEGYHVGMVIGPEDIGIKESKRLLLWESNTLVNLNDVELNKTKDFSSAVTLPIIKRGQLLEGPLLYVQEN